VKPTSQKLVIFIVSGMDADRLLRSLVARGYPATKIGSSGGFLRRGNATILSGVDESEVDEVISIARAECRVRTEYLPPQAIPFLSTSQMLGGPLPVRVGGATIFVLPVDRFERT
jgi:uncharacterized protein YaaQ